MTIGGPRIGTFDTPAAPYAPTLGDFLLSGLAALLLLGLAFLLYELVFARSSVMSGAGRIDQAVVAAAVAAQAAAMIGAIYVLVLRRRRISWRQFGLRPISHAWLAGSAAAGALCVVLISLLVVGLQDALGLPPDNPQADLVVPGGFTWSGLILMLLFGGLAVPFAEELMFRGLLFPWLRRMLPIWPSALLSAALFGALHMQLEIAAGAFFVGLVAAFAYEKSGSLWPPVVIHAVQNSLVILLMFRTAASG